MKNPLLYELADELGLTLKDSKMVIDAVSASITALLSEGEDVKLPGVGTFHRGERKSKDSTVSVVTFRSSSTLKKAVRASSVNE